MFIAIAFFSIANTAHCNSSWGSITVTYKEYARLVALAATAEFAILGDEVAHSRLSGGSRLTAQEIRIRYKFLKVLLASVDKECLEFESLEIHRALTEVQGELYKILVMESRGKYTPKINAQIQTATKGIADLLAELVDGLIVGGMTAEPRLDSAESSCEIELSSSLPNKELLPVQEVALPKTYPSKCKGKDSWDSGVGMDSNSGPSTESGSSSSSSVKSNSAPVSDSSEDSTGSISGSNEQPVVDSTSDSTTVRQAISLNCPPPPPPPPMIESWNSGYEMLLKLLDSFKCGRMNIKAFHNPSLFDSLGNPTVLNEFNIPNPFIYDFWNKWYFEGQIPGPSHSNKVKKGVSSRVEEVIQSVETFKDWLVLIAEGNVSADGSEESKRVVNFLLKHTKLIAYFEKKMERDLAITNLDDGVRAQISKAEVVLSNIESEARKFLVVKSEIEGRLKTCDLSMYLAEVAVQAGHSTRLEF
ncbi:MAG: hypothetical protein ABI041_06605, partial [Bdellovibrionia bacterium]